MTLARIILREPRPEELDDITRLWREMLDDYGGDIVYGPETESAWRTYVKHIINSGGRGRSRVIVAEVDGELVGYMLYEILNPQADSPYKEHIYISDLVVDRRHRRKGIASLMLKQIIGDGGGELRRIFLRVPTRNNAALNLYVKHGFRISEYVMELVVDHGE